ncbi:serine/threonine-protein phosphatase 4 catalytic subunit-like isoform X2 [Rhodnius prolixus]
MLRKGEKMTETEVRSLCTKVKEYLPQEPNVLNLEVPISICGDIHGQLPDLIELFTIGGELPWQNYLFLGDYVDRGYHSTEVFLLLIALKARYPTRIYLIRGNHETRDITQVYGFYDEVLRKYGSINVWKECSQVFDMLPISASIVGKCNVFCVHGGLSPSIQRIDEIRVLDRFQDVPHQGEITDLLWSDPEDSKRGWESSPRGAGYLFGIDVSDKFRDANDIDYIARAHQLVLEGYRWHFRQTVLTVWSAPNYCYRCGNLASIYEISEKGADTFSIFDAAPQAVRMIPEKSPVPEYFL